MMKKILVIENRSSIRNLFLKQLEAEGFYTMAVDNDIMGFQQALKELPDLIISGISMPQLDGYSLLTKLRQHPSTMIVPFIFVTDKVSQAEIRKGMELGADDYITKPFKFKELLKAIAIRLERQTSFQKYYTLHFSRANNAQNSHMSKQKESQFMYPDCPRLKEVFNFIENNYYRSCTLNTLAQEIGYSKAYLTDLVRRQTGKTVNQWIIERRMAATRSLLRETNQSVNEIAEAVGYHHKGHFFRQFREHHQMTPQAWRQNQVNILYNQ